MPLRKSPRKSSVSGSAGGWTKGTWKAGIIISKILTDYGIGTVSAHSVELKISSPGEQVDGWVSGLVGEWVSG